MQIANGSPATRSASADMLRRAMGKKEPEEMAEQRDKLRRGRGEARLHDSARSSAIFDLMEKFAGYGFNKSHSAAYALLTYQTAYLKAHYPVEFMAALLTSEHRQHRQGGEVHQRMPRNGDHGAAAGRERQRRQLHPARRRPSASVWRR